MATTTSKIKDFYNMFSNPAGGLPGGYSFQNLVSAPSRTLTAPAPRSLNSLFSGAPAAPTLPVIPPGPMSRNSDPVVPQAPVVAKAPVAAPVVAPGKPVFAGSAAPAVAPTGATGPAAAGIPPQWIKPGGGLYTPDEVAANISKAVTATGKNGDIAKIAGDQFGNTDRSAQDLETDATLLNNTRNDIAVGATDPYKVASDSGIAYTPAELAAIEKAYSGVYDPALASAMSRLDAKKKSDADATTAAQKSDADERDHQYDLENMKKQFEYDAALKKIVAPGSGSGSSSTASNQIIDNERAAQTLFQNNPIVKDYNTIIGQKNSMDAIVANGIGGPADVNAIFTFMKALDPNSVVRESEYDKAAASGNLFQGAFSKFNGYFKDKGGFLPDNVRDEFQNLINQRLAAKKNEYQNVADQTRAIVSRQNLNPDNVVIDFTGGLADVGSGGGAGDGEAAWVASAPDYDNDVKNAKAAISQGADPAAVKARLLKKYKQVDL